VLQHATARELRLPAAVAPPWREVSTAPDCRFRNYDDGIVRITSPRQRPRSVLAASGGDRPAVDLPPSGQPAYPAVIQLVFLVVVVSSELRAVRPRRNVRRRFFTSAGGSYFSRCRRTLRAAFVVVPYPDLGLHRSRPGHALASSSSPTVCCLKLPEANKAVATNGGEQNRYGLRPPEKAACVCYPPTTISWRNILAL